MAHFATQRFNYWSQLGILTSFCGIGLIIGGIASLLPIMGKLNLGHLKGGSMENLMKTILTPENATALRWMQFITTLFLFFLPPVLYALICHKKPFLHLGFRKNLNTQQGLIAIFIMLAALPIVGALQELTEMLPWSKAALQRFKLAEDTYNQQVAIMARMNNFQDYVVSVIVIAFLPAVFEETLFRGGIQNLFSRWFKMPILAIIVTSIIFSAIHGSYLGFLSRFALGFILGWMYYRTGNLWLSIIGHFFNNAVAVTAIYVTTKPGEKMDPAKMDENFPLWVAVISIGLVYGLFVLFERAGKATIDRPGEEVKMPGVQYSSNPFENDPPVINSAS